MKVETLVDWERGLPRAADTGASGPALTPDDAQAETPSGVAWSHPSRGITGDLGGPLSESIGYGYCECGCGEETVVSPTDNAYYGYKRGVPRRIIHGHHVYKAPTLPDAPATMHAWAAGIIDGEGCIHITETFDRRWQNGQRGKDGKAYRQSSLSVSVSQSGHEMPPMLTRLHDAYGGSIGKPSRAEGRKPSYRWMVSAEKAEALLICVVPYLVQKRDQGELALEYRRNALGRGKAMLAAEYALRLAQAKTK